jgi:hypothetical protein
VIAPASVNRNTTPWDALSGQYLLHPGAQRSIVGQRPVLGAGRLGRLLQGQRGEQVSRTLSSVFTLCAHAHRRTADMVLTAAKTDSQEFSITEPPVLLWIETARDHLRSIALEWPQRLPELTTDVRNMEWLRDCPLSLVTSPRCADATAAWETLAAFRKWLESRVLKQSVAHWLAAHRHPDALVQWCEAQAMQLLPARCLAAWHPIAHVLTPETRCLDVLSEDIKRQTVQLRQLALTLINEPDFVQRPTWQGQCAETGPWARLRHRSGQTLSQQSAWTRLSARWVELIDIAAVDPQTPLHGMAPLLASGALHLGAGQALAWCEMARGLLLHWVQLDGDGGVQDYRVLAPTEWNFHPDGTLAKALTALPFADTVAAQALAAAFDPCVACSVQNLETI